MATPTAAWWGCDVNWVNLFDLYFDFLKVAMPNSRVI